MAPFQFARSAHAAAAASASDSPSSGRTRFLMQLL